MAGWLGGWVAGWPGGWVAGRLEPPPSPSPPLTGTRPINWPPNNPHGEHIEPSLLSLRVPATCKESRRAINGLQM